MGTTIKVLSVVCMALWSCMLLTNSAPQTALITHLPGFSGTFPSKHYAGYVTIGENKSKKLFYYFVESQRMPKTDPVVLWLNGGPGCSSFDGFIYEHGPFNFVKGKTPKSMPTLHLNPYCWSKVSNMIYLDSPTGVGLSFSGNKSDYVTGDAKTAIDSHEFLLNWFGLYPEFVSNPFYLSGESYAGVYVPTLAQEVVNGLHAGVKPILNFKGYMVGNGLANDMIDLGSHVPFAHGMGLISDDLYNEAVLNCKGIYYNSADPNCVSTLAKIDKVTQDLNVYNTLEPCYHSPNPIKMTTGDLKLPPSFRKLGETERPMPVRKSMFSRAWPLQAFAVSAPCIDHEAADAWLNNEQVRKAIHAETVAVSGPWELCTDRVEFGHEVTSVIPYHKNLTSLGYRALIYSGDHDLRLSFVGSEQWVKSVGYKIVDEWRPWFIGDQVAGFTEGYDKNFTFLTILGAGHAVPETKPQQALEFYTRWLDGKKF